MHANRADTLESLADDFPGYCLWRSRDSAGNPASYCATRTQPLTSTEAWAGMARTLIAASAEKLREQLEAQQS